MKRSQNQLPGATRPGTLRALLTPAMSSSSVADIPCPLGTSDGFFRSSPWSGLEWEQESQWLKMEGPIELKSSRSAHPEQIN